MAVIISECVPCQCYRPRAARSRTSRSRSRPHASIRSCAVRTDQRLPAPLAPVLIRDVLSLLASLMPATSCGKGQAGRVPLYSIDRHAGGIYRLAGQSIAWMGLQGGFTGLYSHLCPWVAHCGIVVAAWNLMRNLMRGLRVLPGTAHQPPSAGNGTEVYTVRAGNTTPSFLP